MLCLMILSCDTAEMVIPTLETDVTSSLPVIQETDEPGLLSVIIVDVVVGLIEIKCRRYFILQPQNIN